MTAIDLFCGCGGFSLGFMQAGFEVVAGLENDPSAAVTYLTNLAEYPVQLHYADDADRKRLEEHFERQIERQAKRKRNKRDGSDPIIRLPTAGSGWIASERRSGKQVKGVSNFFFGDIRKWTGQMMLDALGMQFGEVTCIMGGPPCQGFSRMNTRRNCMDPRNSLVFEFARIICEIKPAMMAMENVPDIVNMVTPEGIPVIDALCHVLEQGDMGSYEGLRRMLLSTSGCGAAVKGARSASEHAKGSPAAEEEDTEGEDGQLSLFEPAA